MRRLHLFGQPELCDAEGQSLSVRTSTSLRLLAYLCRHRDEAHNRDHAASILWPESEEPRARQNLRQALHHLRHVLEPDDASCLHVDRHVIQLKPDAPLWVDVEAFERHLQQAENGDDADRADHLESAIALYRGDFLQGCDEDWAIEEREFLKARYIEALDGMVELCTDHGATEDAIDYAQRILRHNPLREDVHRRLMALFYATGDRTAAIDQYQRCRRRLGDDLGVPPDSETDRLYRAIEAKKAVDDTVGAQRERTPSNLPHLLTRFVGRDDQLQRLAQSLETDRLVTLMGVGGCGKTRLALEVGHRLKAEFADGVWFIDLAPLTDPNWIPQAIASTLKLSQSKIQAVTDELIEHFRESSTLLILDNCEHLIDACARLARRLLEACPQLSVLATSRESLQLSGERIWRLDPLPIPDYGLNAEDLRSYALVRMFLDHARGYRPDFRLLEANAGAVASICRASEGIPLAIELAAAWLRVLSAPEIAARLSSDLGLLTTETRDAPSRHRSIQTVFDHSWELISERSQRLFMRLSTFRGGFTRKAAESVAGASLMQLSALLDKSLLYRDDDGRYGSHELLRQFGEAKLEASGEADATRERHLAFYRELAETAEPHLAGESPGEWLRRLTAESDNLRAALSWALETGRSEDALRMAAALARFWNLRGHLTEGRQWLDQALERVEEAELATQAKALHQAGELAWRQGDYASTEECQRESLFRYRQLADQSGISQALVGLGRVAHEQGRLDEAEQLFTESLEIERSVGNGRGTAVALGNLGEVMLEQGDPQGARDYLQQSLDILRELGDRSAECNVLNNLGYVASVQGEIEDARAYLHESLSVAREIDDKRNVVMALGNLGNLAMEESHWDRAADSLSEVLEIFRAMNDRRNLSVALNKLGQVALEQRQAAQAQEYLIESLMISHELDDKLALAEALCGISEILQMEDRSEDAAQLQGTISRLLEQIGASLQGHECRVYKRTARDLESCLGKQGYARHVERGQQANLEDVLQRLQEPGWLSS